MGIVVRCEECGVVYRSLEKLEVLRDNESICLKCRAVVTLEDWDEILTSWEEGTDEDDEEYDEMEIEISADEDDPQAEEEEVIDLPDDEDPFPPDMVEFDEDDDPDDDDEEDPNY